MNKNIVYIADFFENEVLGGAEICGAELIKCLSDRGYGCTKIKSQNVTPESLQQYRNSFVIVSNHKMLSEQSKNVLMIDGFNYAVLEHDHGYCKSNNPILYKNLVIPEDQIQDKVFYSKAKTVFCQSKLHAETIEKNLLSKNLVNLGCNLWSDSSLELLKKNMGKTKTRKFGIMETNNKNKGMPEAITYCKKNRINYELIPFCEPKFFVEELAKTETLVFLPTWMETFCRVAVEARILGCKLITNKSLGCATEPFFVLKGQELLDAISAKKNEVMATYEKVINGEEVEFFHSIELPKISVITTIYKAGEHIKGFIESFLQQTVAKSSELIIIDANSPDNEQEIIGNYLKENKNIQYTKLNEKITTSQAFNIATEQATGDFIACVLIDDRMAKDYLEVLGKHLMLNPDIDLVYGDVLQTTKPNETVEKNSSRGRIYEHSKMDFSKENLIKSLPGVMPLYRKSAHEKVGGWNEELLHACDWDFWLRMVDAGSIFKKVNKVVGLYYFNPSGLSTSTTDMGKVNRRRKEENECFYKYKHIFGENVFNTFKAYFDSLIS